MDLQPTVQYHPLLGITEENSHGSILEDSHNAPGAEQTGGAFFDWSTSSDVQFKAFRM